MRQTEIEAEKIWVGKQPHRKVVGIKNVIPFSELPGSYKEQGLNYGAYEAFPDIDICDGISIIHTFKVGDVMPDHVFQVIVKVMKASGNRLTSIRRKERQKNWCGTETIKI
jgi:hypothetical protein